VVKFESLDPEIRGVLGKKVSELGLRVEGSPVEGYVRQLYDELERRGLKKFRPVCYLTDEWGCPDQQPVLGIPFYLADPKLRKLEKAVDALETDRQVMMYMRHEAGHVFNYAYRLYTTPEWRQRFGPFFRAYRDEYRPVPFSRNYVRHIEGWYAQKHPDEDFAETFAVWLTPRSAWRRRYKGWPAMQKLRYVERVGKALADVDPVVNTADIDVSVEQFYQQASQEKLARIDIALDAHLPQIFPTRKRKESKPAADIVSRHRPELVEKITYWTGVARPIVSGLIDSICQTCERMKLWGERGEEARYLVEVTALATTLAMNFLTRGRFET
jgi:putative zinc-binding metallo-peptidase